MVAVAEIDNAEHDAVRRAIVAAVHQQMGLRVDEVHFLRRGALPKTSSGKVRQTRNPSAARSRNPRLLPRRPRSKTVGSTKDEVQVSYDVSNEFFRLWLDERMNYTCAVFENENQSLEAAQLNKLRILADFAQVTPDKGPRHRLRLGREPRIPRHRAQVKNAVGVTLSSAQTEEINRREIPASRRIAATTRTTSRR